MKRLICVATFHFLIAVAWQTAVADEPLHVRIDQLINAKASGPLAAKTSDEEFLRRVYLDLAGRVPSLSETQSFLADRNETKRIELIDALLAGLDYARRMTEQFHVMLMERLGDHEEWTRYLTQSFQSNKPWDQMVKEMMNPNADSESVRGAAFFLSKRLENYGQNPVDYPSLVRDVGRLIAGIDVQCAQCHDHLFIQDYKQQDYQGLLAFLGQVTLRQDVKFPAVRENLVTKKVAFKSVFAPEEKMTGPRLPGGLEIEIPIFDKGDEYVTPPDKNKRMPGVPKFSPLKVLSEVLPRSENELFRKNIANRLWWVLMGRGLVHPLDLHHHDNPPSHPELLEQLANELASHQFDMKWLLREIALSDTYQRSSQFPAETADVPAAAVPANSYRVFLEKPLSAEQLVVSLIQVTGAVTPAISEPESSSSKSGSISTELRARFLKAYANPPREPEGEHAPTLKAALFLMNDAEVLARFQPADENLTHRLSQHDDASKVAEELYLAVLTRLPDAEEIADVREYLEGSRAEGRGLRAREGFNQRAKAIAQLSWSLVASTEFSVNH